MGLRYIRLSSRSRFSLLQFGLRAPTIRNRTSKVKLGFDPGWGFTDPFVAAQFPGYFELRGKRERDCWIFDSLVAEVIPQVCGEWRRASSQWWQGLQMHGFHCVFAGRQ